MKNNRCNIDSLIGQALSGDLSNDDKKEFNAWLAESEANKETFDAYQEIWHDSGRLLLPGKIDLDDALTHVKSQRNGSATRSVTSRWWLRVAAIFLMGALLTSVVEVMLYFDRSSTVEQTVYQEVKAAFGTQSKLQLADGTVVYLNSGSKLHFPLSFSNQKNRVVTLEGEGYFDVTKNTQKPFIVRTSDMDVKVLGTSFNVQAYPNTGKIEVALVEGAVELHKPNDVKGSYLAKLKPYDVSTYLVAERVLKRVVDKDMYKYMAWKDGKIMFVNAPMTHVVQTLENWYNISIKLENSQLNEFRFTASFKDESLAQVLNLLSLTSPMNYNIENAVKNSDNSYSKRRVTLRMREEYN